MRCLAPLQFGGGGAHGGEIALGGQAVKPSLLVWVRRHHTEEPGVIGTTTTRLELFADRRNRGSEATAGAGGRATGNGARAHILRLRALDDLEVYEGDALTPSPSPCGRGESDLPLSRRERGQGGEGRNEGRSEGRSEGRTDNLKYLVNTIDHVVIAESHNCKAIVLCPGIASGILLLTVYVARSIYLDDEPGLVTVKVSDIRANIVLTAKLSASKLTITQALPQQIFGNRLVLAKLLRSVQQLLWNTPFTSCKL